MRVARVTCRPYLLFKHTEVGIVNSEGFLAEVFHPWVRWEGPGSGFENSSAPAPVAPAASGNPSGWAQAGPKWVGPRRAQVGGPTPGPSWAQVGGPTPGPSWAQVGGPKLGPGGPKPEIWDPKKSKKQKFSKSKSVLPKMSGIFFLAGKRPSRPHLGPSRPIFCVGRKNPKKYKNFPIFPGGPMVSMGRGQLGI